MFPISQQWLAPAVLGAVLGALAQYLQMRRPHRGRRLREVKVEKYGAYLGRLESLARATNLDLRAAGVEEMPSSLEALLTTRSSGSLPADVVTDLSRLSLRMSYALAGARDGLVGLRLVSSPQVLGMLEEYLSLQRRLYSDAVAIIEARSRGGGNGLLHAVTDETAARVERAERLLHVIVGRMRQEIGVDG
jgi:hypothetical protein